MRAAELYGDRRLAIVERPDPVPGPGEVLIAPRAVGICATDIEIRDGTMAYYRLGLASYPVVPGHEWSGEVVRLGADVSGFAVGDPVVGEVSLGCGRCELCRAGRYHLCADLRETGIMGRQGALATLMTHPAAATHRLPEGLSWSAAALVEPTSVALNAVRRGGVAGKSVLVIGTGTIGLLAVQCARAEGARRTVAANPSAGRLDLATRLGADDVMPLAQKLEEAADALATLLGPGADVVIVCSGAPSAVDLALRAARPAATVVLVGLAGAPSIPMDHDLIVTKDLELRGVNGSPGIWPETIALVAGGQVATEPLITHRLPLDQTERALELVRERAPGTVKVLVEPRS